MSFEILLSALIACATFGLAMACARAATDNRRAQRVRATVRRQDQPHSPKGRTR